MAVTKINFVFIAHGHDGFSRTDPQAWKNCVLDAYWAHSGAQNRWDTLHFHSRISSVHIYSQVLTNIFNDFVKSVKFRDILKYTDITPAFKKGDTTDKTNHRSIRTLPNLSKVFEKMIYAKINSFMEPKLSKYLTRFRAKHNIQHDWNDWKWLKLGELCWTKAMKLGRL